MHIYKNQTCSNAPETGLKESYQNLSDRIDKKDILGEYAVNVQLQTVSACNATCSFCPYQGSWHQKNPGKMTDEVFKKIVEGLKEYEIRKFCPYLENEPLLDKDIFKRIQYVVKELKPKCVEISTNLSMLNDRILEEIAETFSNIPHEFRISFHGHNKETYEEIMGLDFDKAYANVFKVVELAQKYPLNIYINGAGTPKAEAKNNMKNWFSKEDYLKFWEGKFDKYENKPNVVYFSYHDRAGAKQLKNRGMTFDIYRENLDNFYCIRFDRWAHFLYTGEPILCCMDYNRETAFPDSIKNKTVKELYTSEHYKNLIKKAIGKIDSEDSFICKRCISPGG